MNCFANQSEQCHPDHVQPTGVPVMGTPERKIAGGYGHILDCVLCTEGEKKAITLG